MDSKLALFAILVITTIFALAPSLDTAIAETEENPEEEEYQEESESEEDDDQVPDSEDDD